MIFSVLKSLALGIWLGAFLMLGYGVAAPIFQQSPSKTLAGTINGIILGRMNNIEWVCWVVALISSIVLLILNWSAPRVVRVTQVLLIIIAGILLWFYSSNITNRMDTLRSTIGDFDHPGQTTEYIQAKAEFDILHHRYTMLVGINMIILLGTFVLSIVDSRA